VLDVTRRAAPLRPAHQLRQKAVDLLTLTPETDVEVLVNQIVRQESLISDSRKPQLRKLVYKLCARCRPHCPPALPPSTRPFRRCLTKKKLATISLTISLVWSRTRVSCAARCAARAEWRRSTPPR